MLAFTIRRILIAIPVFFGVTLLCFGIANANPKGAEASVLKPGREYTAAQLKAIDHRFGLDVPLFPNRYVVWLRNFAQGDLGYSVITRKSVLEEISYRVTPTVILMGSSLLIQYVLAIPLGIFSALRRGSAADSFLTTISFLLFALPTFWFGLMSIVVFGVFLGLLPFGGIVDVLNNGGFPFGTDLYWNYFRANPIPAIADIARHVIMPAAVLGLVGFAGESRFLRGQMLSVLNQDYIRTARAKGLPQRLVIYKHALRNAIMPTVTNFGLQLPVLLAGAVVTESIFSWPGMGRYYIEAANNQDYPVVVAYTVLLGMLVLVSNILTDLSYGLVDPRIRYD